MTNYQKKILSGQTPTDSDWNDYLRASHEVAPSMTPNAYEAPKSSDGLNSYQVLVQAADDAEKPKRVLDLACGDGHLAKYIRHQYGPSTEIVGVDMSDREIALAKQQYRDDGIAFRKESAAQIHEPNHSFDLVLCHMAFMLMSPLDAIIGEVARVLRPGGYFVGIVGGGPISTGFLPVYQGLFREFMKQKFPLFKPVVGGDPRARTSDGLMSVLSTPLFKETKVTDFTIAVIGSSEQTWRFFKNMYNVTLLPAAEMEEFRSQIITSAEEHADASGKLTFEFPMRLFKTRRA
jgi:ubiquinone/menaquinone biosynthesis C-methylase UbiE